MRCPKCSFISFDMVESCTKCGKDISKTAEELKGTIAEVEAPSFLKMDFESYGSEAFEETGDIAGEEAMMDLEIEEGEEFVDFALEEEGETAAEAADFEVEEESAVEAEPEFEIGVEEPEEELQEEPIGISDLSPADEPVAALNEEEFQFESEAAVDEHAPPADYEAKELEDLEVEGIDLESSSAPASGKVMPSVKTGTALDDFDIDLGDLITSKKEKSGK